jgi:hypothetical protein
MTDMDANLQKAVDMAYKEDNIPILLVGSTLPFSCGVVRQRYYGAFLLALVVPSTTLLRTGKASKNIGVLLPGR